MKLKSMVLLFAAACISVPVFASTKTNDDQLIKKVEKIIGEGQVVKLTPLPNSDLIEVQSKQDLFYMDKKGDRIFFGRMIEAQTGKDLTAEREDQINKVDVKSLPLEMAIKTVIGNGSRTLITFEDPNCGVCKSFKKVLNDLKNVTIYTFQYNILSQDSIQKSINVWCSEDKSKAWNELMLNNVLPKRANPLCRSPHEDVMALGRKLKLKGTPSIIFADGSRSPGYIGLEELEERMKVKAN